MKYGMFIKPIRAYVHMIFDKEHLFGVTRGFNIMWDYYDRAEEVRNEKELLKVVKSINKKSKELGYRIDLVKQTIKAINAMGHHLYQVIWSSKYPFNSFNQIPLSSLTSSSDSSFLSILLIRFGDLRS